MLDVAPETYAAVVKETLKFILVPAFTIDTAEALKTGSNNH